MVRRRWSRNALFPYLDSLRGIPLLTAAEERELGARVQAGDQAARERFIWANLRLVVAVAKETRVPLSMEEKIAEGNTGLCIAVDRFDPERGVRFSTYACWWIRQAISSAAYKTHPRIHIPHYLFALSKRVDLQHDELSHRLGHEPTDAELATAAGIAPEKVARVRDARRALAVKSFADLGDEPGGTSSHLDEVKAIGTPDPLVETDTAEWARLAVAALATLPERERMVMVLRFGLGGEPPLTLKQIGARLSTTREWARQLQIKAVRRLRKQLTAS